MPWSGSGSFSRTNGDNTGSTLWDQDRTDGDKIVASRHDTHDQDLSDGINACLAKNGENAATANLNMGSFRLTTMADGTARTDAATVGQIQDADNVFVDGGGTADAITATYAPAITAVVDGMVLYVRATAANATTTPTFSPNGLTARTITKTGGNALAAGDIVGDGHVLALSYEAANTRWELLNPGIPTAGDVSGPGSSTNNALVRWNGTGGDTIQNSAATLDDNDLLTAPGGFAGAKGGDIASAGTLVIGTDGDYFDITGTTSITGMTVAAGRWFMLQFDAALTLTDGASLVLPGNANITTAAGDQAVFYATAANTVFCVSYTKADGTPVVTGAWTDGPTGTDGEIPTFDASGDPAFVSAGSSGQVLTSNGAGAAPTFQTLSGGSMVLIGSTESGGSDASITITGLSSTYDDYIISCSNMAPQTDDQRLLLRVGSTTIDSGASDYANAQYSREMAGTTSPTTEGGRFLAADSAIRIIQSDSTNGIGNGAGESGSCWIHLTRAASTYYPQVSGHAVGIGADGNGFMNTFSGLRSSAVAIDRIQVLFASGNIVAGRVTVWGIAHA